MPVLFVIALVLSVLKVLGYVALSWFWIAFLWPIFPLVVTAGFLAWVWSLVR